MSVCTVRTLAEVDALEQRVRDAANRVPGILAEHSGDGVALLRKMKFEKIGVCPFEGGQLNFIEQVNQTFTTLATLRATRLLMERHPEAGGFKLSLGWEPGADIESLESGVVAAEVFSAMTPHSNNKLRDDSAKMAKSTARHRYVFFNSPGIAEGPRPDRAAAPGVQIWAISV